MTCTITRSPLIERTKSQEMPLTRITFMFDAVEGESVTGTSLRSLCPMIIMMTNFLVNIGPSIENHAGFLGSMPIATSKVPAGQMYLQNPGTGIPCSIP